MTYKATDSANMTCDGPSALRARKSMRAKMSVLRQALTGHFTEQVCHP